MKSVGETVNTVLATLESIGYVFTSDARSKVVHGAQSAKTRGDVAKILSALLPVITLASPDYGRKS